jgi:glutamine amidotransferase
VAARAAGALLIPVWCGGFQDTVTRSIYGLEPVRVRAQDHPLFEGYSDEEYVYFVHSYYADTTPAHTLTTTDYICRFASTIGRDNVIGVQFHPEKSGTIGLRLLRNFIGML